MAATQLRVLGWAAARVSANTTAYAHRDKRIMANVATMYGSPEERSTHAEWATALAGELQTADGAGYVGFLADEGEGRVRNAYPGVDLGSAGRGQGPLRPGHLFRLNQNVAPG